MPSKQPKQMQQRMLSIQAIPDIANIRVAELFGDEHTVIPAIALVEGVLWPANSPHAELALAEEFGRFPEGWNGRPVVLGHPRVDDEPVPANTPSVLDSTAFGQLFNTVLEDKKLKTEIWINNARVAELGEEFQAAVDRLKNGDELVEVSTGLFMMEELVSGTFEGEDYEGIWRNIVPDHFAILPEGIAGACSVEDGCGAPRTNKMKPVMRAAMLNVNACICEDEEDGVTTNEGIFKRLMSIAGGLFSFTDNSEHLSDSNVRSALQAALDVAEDGRFVFILAVFSGGDDSGTVIYELGFDGSLFERTFSIEGEGTGAVNLGSEKQAVRPVTQFVPVTIVTDSNNDVQENAMNKDEIIGALIGNKATQFTEDDRAFLEGLEEDQLAKLSPVVASEEDAAAETARLAAEEAAAGGGNDDDDDGERQPVDKAAMTTEEYIADAPRDIQSILNESITLQRQRKDTVIKAIIDCARNSFSKKDLEKKSVAELESIANLAQDISYVGANLTLEEGLRNNAEDEIGDAPLVFPKENTA